MQVTEVSTSDHEQARMELAALFSQKNKSFVVQQLVPQCSQVERDLECVKRDLNSCYIYMYIYIIFIFLLSLYF